MRRPHITAALKSPLAMSSLVLLLAVGADANAQNIVSDGPPGPAWQAGFPGVPDSSQNPDRDVMFPFHFSLAGTAPPAIADSTPANVSAEHQLFSYQVPGVSETLVSGLSMANPTGLAKSPRDEEIWFADYDGNKIWKFDMATEVLSVVHDGDAAGSPLDGPWDVQFAYVTPQSLWGSVQDPDRIFELQVVVSSRNNDRLIRMDLDGDVLQEYTDSRLVEPTELYCTNYAQWLMEGQGCVDMWVSSYGADRVLQFWASGDREPRDCANRFCSVNGTVPGPMGMAYGRFGLIVAAERTNEILQLNYRETTVLVPASAGLDGPTAVALWDPHRDFRGDFSIIDHWDLSRFTNGQLYILDSGNARVVTAPLFNGGTVTPWADTPTNTTRQGLFLIEGLGRHDQGDIFTIDIDDTTDLASLVRYPYETTVSLQAAVPGDGVVGMAPDSFFHRPYRSWFFDRGGQITMSAHRDRQLNFYVGLPDNVASVEVEAVADVQHELPRPVLDVRAAETPQTFGFSVEPPVGPRGVEAEEIILYQLTGCEAHYTWAAAQDNSFGTTFRFPTPSNNLMFNLADLAECSIEFSRVAADPSGTTEISVDRSGFVPGARYCFAAVGRDTDDNVYSLPNLITDVSSCIRPAVEDALGAFCSDAVIADAYDEVNGYTINQSSDPGNPAWFEYTVQGQPSETRHIFAWVNEPIRFNDPGTQSFGRNELVTGGDPLLSLFSNCSGESSSRIAEGQWAVAAEVQGGQTVRFRVSHYEQLNVTWMLLDLSDGPTAELDPPDQLSATTDEDGQVQLCWDTSVVELAGIPISEDFVSYRILRGDVGGPVETEIASGWRKPCYRDIQLPPGVSYDYQIETTVGLRTRTNQAVPLVLTGPRSLSVTGSTSSTDTQLDPVLVDPPTGLTVRQLDTSDQNFFISPGTLVWWDEDDGFATEHTVRQTRINDGSQSTVRVMGGANAVESPANEIGLYCYDVAAGRQSAAGVVQSDFTGYSDLGDTQYCVNLCQAATTPITMSSLSPPICPGRCRSYRGANVLVQRPVEYFSYDPDGYTGLFHVNNNSGTPARICAWSGDSSCMGMVFRGCNEPGSDGNTYMDNVITAGSGIWYYMVEMIAEGGQSFEDLSALNFTVGFAQNNLPASAEPAVALTVADNSCSSRLLVDFVVTNFEFAFDSYISFQRDGAEIARAEVPTGTVDLALDPNETVHEIVALLFENPLEAVYSRRIYTSAGPFTGDINEDCSVDVLDLTILINDILGIIEMDENSAALADMVDDDIIDTLDTVSMVSFILDNM